jgi:DNA-binding NarL/FixJ family response regulator
MLEQIVSTRANVVVLDSVSPVLAEHGVVRELHRLDPAIRVVIVGMESDEGVFLRVGQAGVVGYVLKDASALEVARTIRAVAGGEAVCPAALSAALFQWVARNKQGDGQPTEPLRTNREEPASASARREQELVGLIQQGLTKRASHVAQGGSTRPASDRRSIATRAFAFSRGQLRQPGELRGRDQDAAIRIPDHAE